MAGGGYVVSGDVAAALVSTHRGHIPLKHTAAEDVTTAMWLLPFDLRRIDHPRFKTRAEHCCVAEAERWADGCGTAGQRGAGIALSAGCQLAVPWRCSAAPAGCPCGTALAPACLCHSAAQLWAALPLGQHSCP